MVSVNRKEVKSQGHQEICLMSAFEKELDIPLAWKSRPFSVLNYISHGSQNRTLVGELLSFLSFCHEANG
jgi:hypothetical protein